MDSKLEKKILEDHINKKNREKEILFNQSVFESDERETIDNMNSKNMLPFKFESKNYVSQRREEDVLYDNVVNV